ncbi:hypothetical protein NDU88_008284 [Pleurodeles waltl]|uniref:Uncharacterized protein n=1 Tax=Pleurodeles waltl TaxID=8319 RepID=A0AAV7QRB5_PLEWA|nr:hypothetical protein NDU88_008284 [Pleurodeles waltl]
MDTMAMDIKHLRLDLRKVVERVTTTETEVATLQNTARELQTTLVDLKRGKTQLDECLEDAEDRFRFLGIPERAEEPSVELFLED